MPDESTPTGTEVAYTQLTQVRVPLEQAGEAFTTRDASGRIPIVLIPKQLNRVRNDLVITGVVVLLGAIVIHLLANVPILIPIGAILAVLLIIVGVYRSFIVRVPEGANALLAKGGRYSKTIGSGTHVIQPFIVVTHLVTRREIPFDVPVVEAPTQDNVRVTVDTLVTFSITDPYKFVYSISADDFDQVFQAACQDGLRSMVRHITSEQVIDLSRQDMDTLRETLNADMQSYGVTLSKITITYAQPPADFMQSLEARKLAAVQQAEQAEQQALALRRQTDAEVLQRQEVVARIEREKEQLQLLLQQADMRKKVVELEAEAEEYRLKKMEERLSAYPLAAQYDWEGEQLKVAQALAHNTRAVVQIGSASEITRAFVMSDLMRFTPPEDGESGVPAAGAGPGA